VKLQLHTEPVRRLRETFRELHPSKRQRGRRVPLGPFPDNPPSGPGPPRRYGLDEKLGDAQADRFSDEWHALGCAEFNHWFGWS
jgi:hypothetical protein